MKMLLLLFACCAGFIALVFVVTLCVALWRRSRMSASEFSAYVNSLSERADKSARRPEGGKRATDGEHRTVRLEGRSWWSEQLSQLFLWQIAHRQHKMYMRSERQKRRGGS